MRRFSTGAAAACTILALVAPAAAQTVPRADKRETPDAYPPALPRREGPAPPSMSFEQVRQVPLPGPLPGDPWRRDGTGWTLPVAGGLAIVSTEPELSVRVSPGAPPSQDPPEDPWVVGPDGRFRYRTLPEGKILAQKKGRRRWKRAWSLRVAGGTPAPPLVVGRRLMFGSLDNQVYAVRRDNGHRLWAVDAGDRVSRSLSLWSASLHGPEGEFPVELVLLVPDSGGSLFALDVHDGSRVARLTVPGDDQHLIPPALSVSDGRILVATQRYAPDDAALLVLRLRPTATEQGGDEPLAYNVEHPFEGGSSE